MFSPCAGLQSSVYTDFLSLKNYWSYTKYIGCDPSCSLHAHCMRKWDGKCLVSARLSPDAKIPESMFLADSGRERKNGKFLGTWFSDGVNGWTQ